MTRKLELDARAQADIAEAYVWYEARRTGLGREFVDQVDRTLLLISERALTFAPVHRNVRRIAIRRFPYTVYYLVRSETVIIVAVLHQCRRPQLTRTRVGGLHER